ncbi:unnamed protein product, partial [Iphiclides podalirius]
MRGVILIENKRDNKGREKGNGAQNPSHNGGKLPHSEYVKRSWTVARYVLIARHNSPPCEQYGSAGRGPCQRRKCGEQMDGGAGEMPRRAAALATMENGVIRELSERNIG